MLGFSVAFLEIDLGRSKNGADIKQSKCALRCRMRAIGAFLKTNLPRV